MQRRGGSEDAAGVPRRAEAEAAVFGPPFELSPRVADRILVPASRLERAVRALGRLAARRPGSAGWRELARSGGERLGGSPLAGTGGPPVVLLPALAWGYRFQRPQQLARALARAGTPVLYCEAFRRTRLLPRAELDCVAPGVWRLQLAVEGRPDPYRELAAPHAAEALARLVVRGLRERPRFVLAQLPFWGAAARTLSEALGVPLVYDRLDLHGGFPGVPPAIVAEEERLLARCDLMTASSEVLLAGPEAATRSDALLPNAVDPEDFPERPRSFEPPVRIGYVGALTSWFDADEVARLAAARPAWRLLLAGRVEDARVRALGRAPNVELVGEIPHREVPAFLGSLHALVVPFRELPLTRAVDPVKLYEGLAAGLPVVSRRLPALERWPEPFVYRAEDGSLLAPLERALAEDGPAAARLRRRAGAAETWLARAHTLLALAERLRPAQSPRGDGPSD